MMQYSFLSIGFFIVMAGALGFGIAYGIGASSTGVAALRFTRIWAAIVAAALIATIAYAVISGQWALFLYEFGYGPLVEMGVLAAGWVLIMWFMAHQYAIGRIDLDDRFGRGDVPDTIDEE